MKLASLARWFIDIRFALSLSIVAIVIKLIFPQAFPWLWIGCGLIAWIMAAVIIVSLFFDELSRHVEQ